MKYWGEKRKQCRFCSEEEHDMFNYGKVHQHYKNAQSQRQNDKQQESNTMRGTRILHKTPKNLEEGTRWHYKIGKYEGYSMEENITKEEYFT